LVQKELAYDQHSLTTDADNAEDRLNDDQRNAYETILNVVTNKEGKLFFVYGNGGTSKTFVWTTLLSRLRGQGKIVLAVASSGIASLLLPGGRIAHSRFNIPIDLHDESTCNITKQMKVVELVHKADLIIWDEAPMMHRRAFEVVDRTLRDLMQLDDAQATEKIFDGKTVVLGGAFALVERIGTSSQYEGRQSWMSFNNLLISDAATLGPNEKPHTSCCSHGDDQGPIQQQLCHHNRVKVLPRATIRERGPPLSIYNVLSFVISYMQSLSI